MARGRQRTAMWMRAPDGSRLSRHGAARESRRRIFIDERWLLFHGSCVQTSRNTGPAMHLLHEHIIIRSDNPYPPVISSMQIDSRMAGGA